MNRIESNETSIDTEKFKTCIYFKYPRLFLGFKLKKNKHVFFFNSEILKSVFVK